MDVYMSIQDMIGNTPMLKLNNMGIREQVGVYAKLELLNPEGSIKDRVGMYMLNEAIESGRLQPGGTIVEATAGNTGIGIASYRRKYRNRYSDRGAEQRISGHFYRSDEIFRGKAEGHEGARGKSCQHEQGRRHVGS